LENKVVLKRHLGYIENLFRFVSANNCTSSSYVWYPSRTSWTSW